MAKKQRSCRTPFNYHEITKLNNTTLLPPSPPPNTETKRQFRTMKLADCKPTVAAASKMHTLHTPTGTGNNTGTGAPEVSYQLHYRSSVKSNKSGSAGGKSKSGGSADAGIMHQIPADVRFPSMEIRDEYDVEKHIAEGCFAKILLVRHRPTNTKVVLKAVHAELTTYREFVKEFHYSYQLSHHPNILCAYNVAFQTADYYMFAQEHAPYGDLSASLGPGGLHEDSVKLIAEQLSAALGFMHSKQLVHRDLKLENVLVFAVDFSRVKLCDFGATTKEGTLVKKIRHTWSNFLPPEVIESVKNEKFICRTASDTWQFGIMIYSLLTGNPPWCKADWVHDAKYAAFKKYEERKTTKLPDNFKGFTARVLRAFRKMLNHNAEDRAKVTEIAKYLKDRWMDGRSGAGVSGSRSAANLLAVGQGGLVTDQDSICVYLNQKEARPSMDENKQRLRRLMSTYGLETQLDQGTIKKRIWEWVLKCETNLCDELDENRGGGGEQHHH